MIFSITNDDVNCKMKQTIKYFFFFFPVFISVRGVAQVSDTLRWSLTDCFSFAAGHNIQINTLRLNQQSAKQDLAVAKAAKTPNLEAEITSTFNNRNNSNGNSGLVNQLVNAGDYALTSSVLIWNGNALNHTIQLNRLQFESDALLIQQSLNNIQLQITGAYLNILLAKENLTYFTDLVNTSQALVRRGQQFYKAGSIAKKDLLELQAQLAGNRYLQVQAQNAVRQNLLTLKQILQLTADSIFDIISPDTIEVPTILPPLEEVRRAAFNNFPDVKIGHAGMAIASANISIAKAHFMPVLSVYGSLASANNFELTHAMAPKTAYFTQIDNNFYQQLGLTLSIPVFTNRLNRTNLEKARINYRQAYLNLQNDQLVLSQAIEQYYINAENAIQSFQAAEELLTSATESYRIVNAQFRLGGATIYDLLQQQNQYVQSFQQYIQAKYSAVLEQKIYLFYNGIPITL
jgi:outer membrane protein